MPAEINMPQLSDTMSEGTVVKWHKKEGDAIKAGEEIADIETDKAVMPLEAFDEHEGTLSKILVQEGQKVNIGQPIGLVTTKGEKPSEAKQPAPPQAKPAPSGAGQPSPTEKPLEKPAPAGKHEHEEGGGVPGGPLEAGRAQSRRESTKEEPHRTSEGLAREATEALQRKRSGGSGAAVVAEKPTRVVASPLARRIAEDKGVDLSQLQGSGPGGRVVQRDVLAAAGNAKPAKPAEESRDLQPRPVHVLAARMSGGEKQVIPLTKIRSVIAQRLQMSKQTIPHFYETVDIDVEDLVALRGRLNEQLQRENVRLSIGDLITKAIASALVENPALNATFNGKEITRYGDVNLGMAVALPEGLIVPVLRGANTMGFREIRIRSADLIDRARAQRLKQDEMTGATFTVSNLGTHGVREFSAIINPPEVGILAVGTAAKRAVVKNDQIVPRTTMTVTLSADHRAVDGATAAEFLHTLKQLLEEPALMLV
jgi:pyruvate dehydrogenase E2 component (dihydrolipoamide acetyltransferase)